MVRRFSIILNWGLIVTTIAGGALAAYPDDYPLFSSPYEITDSSLGHLQVEWPNPETSMMVRVDNSLYFIYRAKQNSCGEDYRVYVRRFNLSNNTFDSAKLVDYSASNNPASYHDEPSILTDGSGGLHAFIGWSYIQNQLSFGSRTLPPRYRTTTNPASQPSQWPLAGGTPIGREDVENNANCSNEHCDAYYDDNYQAGAVVGDIMGVLEPNNGKTHYVAEASRLAMDGIAYQDDYFAGSHRLYGRIASNGQSFEGPYILVRAKAHEPTTQAVEYNNRGLIFTKGDIVLGHEKGGTRSLHLIWSVRNSFQYPTAASSDYRQWNYDLYYAYSTDGGETWAGWNDVSPSVDLANDPPDYFTYEDGRAGYYSGDLEQNSERSFDLKDGIPMVVFPSLYSSESVMFGWHVDNGPNTTADPVYWLTSYWPNYWPVYVEWYDSTQHNFRNARPRVRVDAEETAWAFVPGAIPFNVAGIKYRYSEDGADWGDHWESYVPNTGAADHNIERIYSYADPIEPEYHYLAYQDTNTGKLYFVRMQMSPFILDP